MRVHYITATETGIASSEYVLITGAVGLDRELGPSSVFHPPSKDTTLSSTSTLGPKTFLFTPQPVMRAHTHTHTHKPV